MSKWRIFFEDLDSEASDFLTNNSFNIEQKTKQNNITRLSRK